MIKNQTPMMKQYESIKKNHKDCILFYRLGDFYEIFNEDAVIASDILNIKLTKRSAKSETLMCGVPHHSADRHIIELLTNNKNVAICEQVGNQTSGSIIERAVTRIYTPSNLIELTGDSKKYYKITSIYKKDKTFNISTFNINNGLLTVSKQETLEGVFEIIKKNEPIEIISNIDLTNITKIKTSKLESYFFSSRDIVDNQSLSSKNIDEEYKNAIYAANSILLYLKIDSNSIVKKITPENNNSLYIDNSSFLNLNLIDGDYSIYKLLNKTNSAAGARRLRESIKNPFNKIIDIQDRFKLLETIKNNECLKNLSINTIKNICDIERASSLILNGTIRPHQLVKLSEAIDSCLELIETIKNTNTLNDTRYENIKYGVLKFTSSIIKDSISDDEETTYIDKFIKDGYNIDVDSISSSIVETNSNILNYIEDITCKLISPEFKITGINVINSKSDGLCIEIPNRFNDKFKDAFELNFDDECIKVKTIKTKTRYKTKELIKYEESKVILNDKLKIIQMEIYNSLIKECSKHLGDLIILSNHISELDVVISFIDISDKYKFKEPVFGDETNLKNTYHPLLILNKDLEIIKNDISFTNDNVHLITGPNMSGKSTFMRQSAVLIILSHMGCPIPHESGTIKLYDKILSRVGANDDMSSGKSTFMMEMVDIANIFKNATKNSFVIIDEVGRGTCPKDGEDIAIAITEGLVEIGCDTIISTHYKNLSNISNKSIKKLCFTAEIVYNKLKFNHKIEDGVSKKSFAIEIAKMAGIPLKIINRVGI